MVCESTLTLRGLQSPITEPVESSHYNNNTLRIDFCHPAYEFPHDILLTLEGFDCLGGGIHHNTALIACAIVAGNQWCGYMTETRDGPRVTATRDEVLRGKKYYFHVPDPRTRDDPTPEPVPYPPYKYPIVSSFREWQFPHNDLPGGWENISSPQPSAVPRTIRTNVAASTRDRDQSCRLSNYRDCISCAHLCPKTESDWFRNNGMGRYNLRVGLSGSHIVNDIRNTLSLRYDLHRDFDNLKFVFAPKTSESTLETIMVAHVLMPTHELGLLYHNAKLHPTPDIPREFFLARFAWTIFPLVRCFLEGGIPRLLIRTQTPGDQRIVETDAATCRLVGIPKTPSRKRRRMSHSSSDKWVTLS